MPLRELAQSLEDKPVKGEIVLLVDRLRSTEVSAADLESDLRVALRDNSVKDAADLVSKTHDLPRRKVYQLALKLAKDEG